ncbi:MAG: hypothetical protein HYW93_06555 [Thaumarchaeota archaeon]|nr:hypothetical protein [Nitrososphaerota archaeon]
MTTNLLPVRNALLSVASKEGLVEFARGLREFGVELMATGGTYNALEEEKVRVRSLQDDLKLPSALSGRVKTLHYPLFAAILAKHEPNPRFSQEFRVRHCGSVPDILRIRNRRAKEEWRKDND